MLMQRRPADKIVPLEVPRQAIDLRACFAFSRTWLEYRVVNANVLALGINLSKDAIKLRLRSSVSLRNPLQQRCHRGPMLTNSICESPGAPQEDSCVPRIIAGRDKLLR